MRFILLLTLSAITLADRQVLAQSFYPFGDGKKWGFVNIDRQIVIPAAFDSVGFPHNRSEHLLVIKNKKQALFSKSGKQLTPFDYDQIDYSMNSSVDYIHFKINGKIGFIDSTGKVICQAKYDRVYSFESNGLCRVMLNKKWGLINTSGKEVMKPTFDELWFFSNDGSNAYGMLNGKACHIDNKGKPLYKPTYQDVSWLEGKTVKYAWAKLNDKFGIIDSKGKAVIPFEYRHIQFEEVAKDGLPVFYASKDDKSYYIKGTEILDDWTSSSNDMVYNVEVAPEENNVHGVQSLDIAKQENGYLITDKAARLNFTIATNYDSITPLSKNYYYKKGELVLKCWKDGKVGLVKESGEILLPVEQDLLEQLVPYSHLLIATRDGKKAIVSLAYTIYKTPYDYLNFKCCSGGDSYSAQYILTTRVDGYKGYLNVDGACYFPIEK